MNLIDNKIIFDNYISKQKIVKESVHDESDMSNPEEKREVQIGMEISRISMQLYQTVSKEQGTKLQEIYRLANELVAMHKQK
jgi:hypothetical protein